MSAEHTHTHPQPLGKRSFHHFLEKTEPSSPFCSHHLSFPVWLQPPPAACLILPNFHLLGLWSFHDVRFLPSGPDAGLSTRAESFKMCGPHQSFNPSDNRNKGYLGNQGCTFSFAFLSLCIPSVCLDVGI